ncbi:MAG: hypothetical protein NT056_01770 [Proteobacteria bacterium]|nr:hypothetical protein [Pseudomonadota bacterium]
MNRNELLNALGGMPDRLLNLAPGIYLRKNTQSRADYLETLAFYHPENWTENQEPFLILPSTAPAYKREEKKWSGSKDISFSVIEYPSRYQPRNRRMVEEYNSHTANLSAYLVLWKHVSPARRPLVLCVHGLQMARPGRAEKMFRIRKLLDLGMDVALYIQPFHWRRARGLREYFLNPNNIPFFLETFAQDIHDLHAGVLLLNNLGYERVGLIGASLGGYALALYAAAGPRADFLFLVVPAVDFSHYLMPRPGGFRFEVDEKVTAATRSALQLVSPLHYPPRFDVGKIKVVMHQGDRLCPVEKTREWIRKWFVTNVVEVVGGHWLYFDHDSRGAAWYGWLKQMGYIQ